MAVRPKPKFCAQKRISITRRDASTDADLNDRMHRYPDRQFASQYERTLEIVVDPVRARFSAWYELFPRSTGPGADQARHL